ncbi:Vacuolar protein sorting-associated protein vps5 [Cryptotrichosporon argae]
MDEEENFARLLSSTNPLPNPSLYPDTSADPWANPFSSSPSDPFAQPFASSSALPTFDTALPTFDAPALSLALAQPSLTAPREDVSPYVSQLARDSDAGRGTLPDPPSVIAAREAERLGYDTHAGAGADPNPYGSYEASPFQSPFASNEGSAILDRADPAAQAFVPPATAPLPLSRKLPEGLIDEDLLAASDPNLSLKRAFVKSAMAPQRSAPATPDKPKAYVFKPATKESQDAQPTPTEPAAEEAQADAKPAEEAAAGGGAEAEEAGAGEAAPTPAVGAVDESTEMPADPTTPTTAANPKIDALSVPLPESTVATPTAFRGRSPVPPEIVPPPSITDAYPSPAVAPTPLSDRVSVSPLDAPPAGAEQDYGFTALSIGGSSLAPPNPLGWDDGKLARGWGEVEPAESYSAVANKAETATIRADPWGRDEDGWGGESSAPFTPAGPEREPSSSSVATTDGAETVTTPSTGTPRRSKLLSTPVFQITVGDPTKVGDPVRGHVVYTVRTRTTSPHYRRGDMAVLRRFSDFLWLFEALTFNNPGVIVPPVPDKHAFGRFQETFIETRRAALERSLGKITNHPILQLDPDLRLFLESDSFVQESKQRRLAAPVEKEPGLLASWTGPKFVEQDEWFDSRRAYLDHLEASLRQLSKALEVASKVRLDMALAVADVVASATALADADLGSAMSAALARLGDLVHREQEALEEQAKADVAVLLNTADEYVRFIASVRLAFASRVKTWHALQAADKEVGRVRKEVGKARAQGRMDDRAQAQVGMAEVTDAERRARDAATDFENVSKLVKSEFARFERDRVNEFKRTLERHLDGQIGRERELVDAWEQYHANVLKMVQRAQGKAAPS